MNRLKIRLGCFETNSSSTHSLTMAKNTVEVADLFANILDETFDTEPRIINDDTLCLSYLNGANGDEEYFSAVIISSVSSRLSFIFIKTIAMIAEMDVTPIVDNWTNMDKKVISIHSRAFKDIINWLQSDNKIAKDIWQTLDTTIKKVAKEYYNCNEWTWEDFFNKLKFCSDPFFEETIDSEWTIENYKQKIKDVLDFSKIIIHMDKPFSGYNNEFKIVKI